MNAVGRLKEVSDALVGVGSDRDRGRCPARRRDWNALARRRTGNLQDQFGPEYDRIVGATGTKSEAEAELQGRVKNGENSSTSARCHRKPAPGTWRTGRSYRRGSSTTPRCGRGRRQPDPVGDRRAGYPVETSSSVRPTSPSTTRRSSRTIRTATLAEAVHTATTQPRTSVRRCVTTARCSKSSSRPPPSNRRHANNATSKTRSPINPAKGRCEDDGPSAQHPLTSRPHPTPKTRPRAKLTHPRTKRTRR